MPARLAIRADGDSRIGLGHMMRCAALAHALLDAGHILTWFSRTPQTVPASLAHRIDVRPLAPGGEAAGSLLQTLTDTRVDGLIGDWQITDAPLCAQLRRAGFWLALIGNHHNGAEADLFIHQGFGAPLAGALAQICEGPEHILLAPGYAGRSPRTIRSPVQRLLISLGGSDTPVLGAVLDALDNLPELEGVIIDIKRAVPGTTTLPATGLLDELCAADIAILGAGTTLHEAAATGLAAIALILLAVSLIAAWFSLENGYASSTVISFRLLLIAALAAVVIKGILQPLKKIKNNVSAQVETRSIKSDGKGFQGRIETYSQTAANNPFRELLAEDALKVSAAYPATEQVKSKDMQIAGLAAAAMLAVLLYMAVGAGLFSYSLQNFLAGWASDSFVPPQSIIVLPGDESIRRGANLRINAQVEGDPARQKQW